VTDLPLAVGQLHFNVIGISSSLTGNFYHGTCLIHCLEYVLTTALNYPLIDSSEPNVEYFRKNGNGLLLRRDPPSKIDLLRRLDLS